jgi:hypothetical protein
VYYAYWAVVHHPGVEYGPALLQYQKIVVDVLFWPIRRGWMIKCDGEYDDGILLRLWIGDVKADQKLASTCHDTLQALALGKGGLGMHENDNDEGRQTPQL